MNIEDFVNVIGMDPQMIGTAFNEALGLSSNVQRHLISNQDHNDTTESTVSESQLSLKVSATSESQYQKSKGSQ